MQSEIEFKNIKKVYGDKVVMEGFSLTVEKGDFVTVIGSSGCGKTTALKMVKIFAARIRLSFAATLDMPFRGASCFRI